MLRKEIQLQSETRRTSVKSVIGIAGRSCSGKSTLAEQLEEKFCEHIVHIGQDKLFRATAPD